MFTDGKDNPPFDGADWQRLEDVVAQVATR